MKFHHKKLLFGFLLTLLVSFALCILFEVGFFSNIQLSISDSLYGGRTPLNTIVIVAIDDKSIQEIGRWPWNRSVFAQTIDNLNGSEVIGIDVAFFEKSDETQDKALGESITNAGNVVLTMEYSSFENKDNQLYGKDKLLPLPEMRNATLAYVNVISDSDGIVRALNVNVIGDYRNFAYEIYKKYWNKAISFKDSRLLVNYVGKPHSYKTYSLSDVYFGRVSPDEFNKKIVLIGATAPDLHDEYFVPTSQGKAMSGVEVHANAIQMMVTGNFLENENKLWVFVSIIIAGIFTFIWVYPSRLRVSIPLVIMALIIYFIFSIKIFDKGIIMNLVYVPMTILATFISTVAFLYILERREKKHVLGALEKYISKDVADEILKNPDKLKLGGVRKKITILFSDIRGFTSLSEKMSAEELVKLLNEYLTEMTNVVLQNRGVIDKFIGDAVMAFWGAPLEQHKQAELACRTALEMQKELEKLNRKWKKAGIPALKIGVGLNTGEAVIGNLGSHERFDYTAIGDNINLGSRLEGLTKQYSVDIIVSESTKKDVKDKFVTRELDLVAVKGRKEPVRIFELVGLKSSVKVNTISIIKDFEHALHLYRSQKWTEAIKAFKKVHDSASGIFIERCEEFRKNPPGKSWDGTYVMKTK